MEAKTESKTKENTQTETKQNNHNETKIKQKADHMSVLLRLTKND